MNGWANGRSCLGIVDFLARLRVYLSGDTCPSFSKQRIWGGSSIDGTAISFIHHDVGVIKTSVHLCQDTFLNNGEIPG